MNNGLSEKRKLIKPFETIIILLILTVAAIFFIIINKKDGSNNNVAQITYDGKIVKTIDLSKANDEIFILDNNKNVSFEIKDKKIRFINTNCPDKLCENIGYIYKINSISICMPNKVSLKIIGKQQDVDLIIN